jgi:hypothetical protein
MSCFVTFSPFLQPLCSFVQPWFPMRLSLAEVEAVATGAEDSMEVGPTSVAVPYTPDVTTAGGALTCPTRSQGTLWRVQQHVEESTAEQPTVLQRLEPQRPALTATTTTAATVTPTAIGSARINIRTDARDERPPCS